MADDERKQFALHELKDVLRALAELGFPCTLIGRHRLSPAHDPLQRQMLAILAETAQQSDRP